MFSGGTQLFGVGERALLSGRDLTCQDAKTLLAQSIVHQLMYACTN